MFDTLVPVPDPVFSDDDAPLSDGELLVAAAPAGREVKLSFASPFEAFIALDDKRVTGHSDRDERRLLIFVHRRLPTLYRALEERLGVRAVLTADDLIVVDVVDLEEGRFLDHGRVRQALAGAGLSLLPFAVLGAASTRAELLSRLRAMYAVGTPVEVRAEEGGAVAARRRLTVGRAQR